MARTSVSSFRSSFRGRNVTAIGLISDTHGVLRKQAQEAIAGSDLILHAGDVGKPEILRALETLAPLVVVKGNVDKASWARALPATAVARLGPVTIYMLHNLEELDIDPAGVGFDIVVSGHSHQPSSTNRSSVLYVNPGSAGPRRFQLPVTVARLDLAVRPWKVDFIDVS